MTEYSDEDWYRQKADGTLVCNGHISYASNVPQAYFSSNVYVQMAGGVVGQAVIEDGKEVIRPIGIGSVVDGKLQRGYEDHSAEFYYASHPEAYDERYRRESPRGLWDTIKHWWRTR